MFEEPEGKPVPFLLYKLSGRADGWACLHAQTYAHPEANRYEQGAMRKAQGESANTGSDAKAP